MTLETKSDIDQGSWKGPARAESGVLCGRLQPTWRALPRLLSLSLSTFSPTLRKESATKKLRIISLSSTQRTCGEKLWWKGTHFSASCIQDTENQLMNQNISRSHRASTPTLGVHTPILFPMFDTGNVILTATLMLAKIEICSILSQETLPLRWHWRLVWMGLECDRFCWWTEATTENPEWEYWSFYTAGVNAGASRILSAISSN